MQTLRVYNDPPNDTYYPTMHLKWLVQGEVRILVQLWKSTKSKHEESWVIVPIEAVTMPPKNGDPVGKIICSACQRTFNEPVESLQDNFPCPACGGKLVEKN